MLDIRLPARTEMHHLDKTLWKWNKPIKNYKGKGTPELPLGLQEFGKGKGKGSPYDRPRTPRNLDGGGWSAPRPGRFTPAKDPVHIVQEAGWAPGPVWTGAENLAPTANSITGPPSL